MTISDGCSVQVGVDMVEYKDNVILYPEMHVIIKWESFRLDERLMLP